MNKLFTKIAGSIIGMAMAIGVGVAVGRGEVRQANATTYNGVMTAGNNSNDATVNTKTAVKCGTSSKAGVMTITLPNSGATQLDVYVAAWSGDSTTVKVTVTSGVTISPTQFSPTDDSGISGSGSAYTLKGTESTYKKTFTLTNAVANTVVTFTAKAASKNRFAVWSPTYESNAGPVSYTVSYDAGTGADGTIANSTGSSITLKTWDDIKNDVTAPSGKYFTEWNTAADGTGTPYEAGATIFESVSLYAQWMEPYTVAEAKAFVDTLGGSVSRTRYVSGIISQIDSFNSTYHSIQYWISDDGSTTSQLEVYSGKGIDGADFSAVTDLSLRDSVIVCGKLKLFSSGGNDVYEFDKNNYLVSRIPDTTPTHNLTYAVGGHGTYDGSTTKQFTVVEGGTHTVLGPSAVGISANEGYVFSAWNDGSNNYSPESSYIMGSSDITLTAQWAAGIGLSYNSNSGSGSMPTTYVASGGTQTVASCSFTAPNGKVFSHWNTAANNSGTSYNPNETIANYTTAIVLYAIWEDAPTFTLVTDASKLTAGTKAIFVGAGNYNSTDYIRAMVQDRTTANSASSVTTVSLSNDFNEGSVATSAAATVFTLSGTAGSWALKNGNNQLGFTGTSNNNMKFNEDMTDTFAITSLDDNFVSVVSNTYNTRNLQFNLNVQSQTPNPRFSNYAKGGQTDIYMFADIAESQFGTIDHIKISHKPNILSWHDGATFSDEGITVVAFDGANENTANSRLLESTEYTSSVANGAIFSDSDIGSKTITITYIGNNSLTDTYSIYIYAAATYELVTSTPTNWAGNYLIVGTIETSTDKIDAGSYAFMSDLDNFDIPTNPVAITTNGSQITTGQEFEWSIASMEGGYSIQGKSGKYIGWAGSTSNGLTSSNSPIGNVISISNGDVTISNEDIISYESDKAAARHLTLSGSSGQFRYYTSGSVKLYKLVESSEAVDYAEDFLEMLSTGNTAVCQVTQQGVVETDLDDLKVAWAILASDFNSLSNADKQLFIQGTADESGDEISQALALYDYVAKKYNTQLQSGDCLAYNFMGRSQAQAANNGFAIVSSNSNNTSIIITVISVLSLTAFGGFFFIKKRKEQ